MPTLAVGVILRAALPRGGALPDDVWRTRHHRISGLLWLHVIALVPLGLLSDYPPALVLVGVAVVAAYAGGAEWRARGRTFRSSMATMGLLTSSLTLIYFFDGLIEAQFHFFITIAIVSLYQAWSPYLLAVGLVSFHQLVLGTLFPQHVFNHPMALERPWLFALISAGAVLAVSAACLVFWGVTEDALDAERAQRDALVVANAELTRASRAVADLVAMLSHDLRVPLSVVIGYSEMALESWPIMSPDEQLDFVHKVHQAGNALHAMLDDTLTVSALDADGVQPRRVPVRVDQAIRDALAHLPSSAPIHPGMLALLEPVTAVVDRGHLDQVLTNLLTNAVKYGAGPFAVSAQEVLDTVVITISDSGPGVPADFVAELFDRFTRADDARRGDQKGTGLGLYITRSLLTANQGAIDYLPTPGGGSTFRVQLPRFSAPSDPMIPPPDAIDALMTAQTHPG